MRHWHIYDQEIHLSSGSSIKLDALWSIWSNCASASRSGILNSSV